MFRLFLTVFFGCLVQCVCLQAAAQSNGDCPSYAKAMLRNIATEFSSTTTAASQIQSRITQINQLNTKCEDDALVQLELAATYGTLARKVAPTNIMDVALLSYESLQSFERGVPDLGGGVISTKANALSKVKFPDGTGQTYSSLLTGLILPIMYDLTSKGIDHGAFRIEPAKVCPYATEEGLERELQAHERAVKQRLADLPENTVLPFFAGELRLQRLKTACPTKARYINLVIANQLMNLAGRAYFADTPVLMNGVAVPKDMAKTLANSAKEYLDEIPNLPKDSDFVEARLKELVPNLRTGIKEINENSQTE